METNWKKNTALFIVGQTITLLGSMVVQYAILWHITLKTQLGSMMTLFTIVGFLPMFFILPFGGVWADRFNRKLITNISDGVIAFVSLVVAVLLMMGYTHFSILLVCAGIRSLGQGVQLPAVGAIIPQIVPGEHLTRINGIQSTIQSLSMLAAPMVSGVLMSFAPLETLFFLDVVTASVFTMVSSSMMRLAMLVFGPAADRVNISSILVGTGIVTALLCILLISNKILREAKQVRTE